MYKELKSSAVLRQTTVDTNKSAALSTRKGQTKKQNQLKKPQVFIRLFQPRNTN